MYGDTAVIRRLVLRLDEQAADLMREADGLVARSEVCTWSGWAADAMRSRTRDRAAALRRTAGRHHDAADALARHADEVDQVKGLIEAAERRVGRLLGELGDLLDRVVPPPPGHRDWLDLDLPGLPS